MLRCRRRNNPLVPRRPVAATEKGVCQLSESREAACSAERQMLAENPVSGPWCLLHPLASLSARRARSMLRLLNKCQQNHRLRRQGMLPCSCSSADLCSTFHRKCHCKKRKQSPTKDGDRGGCVPGEGGGGVLIFGPHADDGVGPPGPPWRPAPTACRPAPRACKPARQDGHFEAKMERGVKAL